MLNANPLYRRGLSRNAAHGAWPVVVIGCITQPASCPHERTSVKWLTHTRMRGDDGFQIYAKKSHRYL